MSTKHKRYWYTSISIHRCYQNNLIKVSQYHSYKQSTFYSMIYCQSIDHQCQWQIRNSVLISRPSIYLHDPTSWCSGIDINPCRCWPSFKLVKNCFTRTPWRPSRSIAVYLGHLRRLVSVLIVTVSSPEWVISGLKFKF